MERSYLDWVNFLSKRDVFRSIVSTLEGINSVGLKWVFVRKWNENNKVIRYNTRLIAQGFSQMHNVNYEETYSPVIDGINFLFLIVIAVSNKLDM